MRDCEGNETPCALGCEADEVRGAACRSFDPTGPATAEDLAAHNGELDINLPESLHPVVFDTNTGAINLSVQGEPENVIRAANQDPTTAELESGVTFERREGVAIFRAKSWTLRNTWVTGDAPIAWIASGSIHVLGHVTAQCGGVGGAAALDESHAGNGGNGSGAAGQGASGGGGGGHHAVGRAGGTGRASGAVDIAAGTGGAIVSFNASSLLGGGRGGHGGGHTEAASTSRGGGGGGVMLLAAGERIRIGDGTPIQVRNPGYPSRLLPKGLNVGGCGGSGGLREEGALAGGGGGGAGGLLILESPQTDIQANAGLAANGGGGGGTGSEGTMGQLRTEPAPGGLTSSENCGLTAPGGDGAAGTSDAANGKRSSGSGCNLAYGSGGGGEGGRVRIGNRSGTIAELSATSVLSPAAGSQLSVLQPQ